MATARKTKRKRTTPRKKSSWRASWKGQMRFGLVSLKVEAVNARSAEEGDIHFHQLHAQCHHRIRYQKVCPVHGEIDNDEIVLGYEFARDQYVEIDPDEVDALRTEKERSLQIESIIDPEALDPIYFDGRMYYLLPSGAENEEPFDVITAALEKTGRWGVGHLVMSGKDQIGVVRAKDGLMQLALLNFAAELREASDLRTPARRKLAPRKLKLAEDLIDSYYEDDFDIAAYHDRYRERLVELIEAKRAGHEVSAPEDQEEAPVINLMDALKRSLTDKPARKRARPPKARRKSSSRKRSRKAS